MTSSLAEQLWQARLDGTRIDTAGLDLPADADAAYAEQEALSAVADARLVGYKIGATSEAAMNLLGLSEPFFGPLMDRYYRSSGENVPLSSRHKGLLECEIVVALSADLPPRDTPYSVDEVSAATEWISPGFELCAIRFDVELPGNGLLLIADSGINADFVQGGKVTDWSQLDLSQHPAALLINGQEVAQGHSGMSVFEHPLAAVAWLANHKALGGRGLKAGDIITTGTCTGMTPIQVGDEARGDFGPLGEVTTRFVEA